MSATVVQLERPFRRNYDWSAKELAEFYRVEAALIQAGLRIDTERGVTDEGDPWFAFCKPGDGDVIVHIARIDGLYILAGPCYEGVATGRDIATLVRDLVNRYPLIQMGSDSRRQNSKIFVHPAALLIAVVATAFFKSTEARALGDTEKSPADDQRLTDGHRGGATIRSDPYPTFDAGKKNIVTDAAQSAIILSAVVAALQTPQPYQIERGLLPSAGVTPDVSELGVLARQQTQTATSAFVAEEPAFRHASNASSLGPAAPAISSQTGLGDIAPAAVPTALLSEALTLVVVLWDLSSKPAAAPIPAHDAGSGSVSVGNAAPASSALLSFKLASSPSTDSLPVVQSVKVAYSATQGTAETHSIARPDELPVALLNALRDGAHTAIDGSLLDLSNSGGQGSSFASALLASVTSHFPTHVIVPSVQQTDVHSAPVGQIEAHSTDHAIVAAVSSVNYADIAALIQDFISHVPVWTRVSEGNQVVLYDVGALSEHGNALKSVTFDFQDGSALSLVGLASALPQSLLHQRDGSEPFLQASQSSSAQAQTVPASAEVQTAPTSAQVQGSADAAAGNTAHSIEVPATSWTDHLPSAVAAALNESARATVSAGATLPSSAGSLAMSLIGALHDPSSGTPLQSLTSPDHLAGANDMSAIVPTAAVGDPGSQVAISGNGGVKSLLQNFVDHTPNYSVISDGNKLILYDTSTLASPADIKSLSFDFADGSTLSLIGIPEALHYSLL